MDIKSDKRVVMTLDAGGTNFVFSAMQAAEQIVEPITRPAHGDQLVLCLQTIVDGFREVQDRLSRSAVAISFAFPGPADYARGVIGDLPNLPAFRGGVALGPMLREKFDLPVFIENDGNLFALGEAMAGLLPEVNRLLEQAGNPKRYRNLLGVTLGTGFGGGIVIDGRLLRGDNSGGAEVHLLRNRLLAQTNVEESISIRAIRRGYAGRAGLDTEQAPQPKEIFEIAQGKRAGSQQAAKAAFYEMALALGEALATGVALIDGLVVIGGGLTGAHDLFLEQTVREMNSHFSAPDGRQFRRLTPQIFNLENDLQKAEFLQASVKQVAVPDSASRVLYDSQARSAVGISRLGTSRAVAIGAYGLAVEALS